MSAPASLTVSLFSLRTIYGRYLSDLLLGFVMQVAMNPVCYQQYWFQMKTETSIEESRYRGKRFIRISLFRRNRLSEFRMNHTGVWKLEIFSIFKFVKLESDILWNLWKTLETWNVFFFFWKSIYFTGNQNFNQFWSLEFFKLVIVDIM